MQETVKQYVGPGSVSSGIHRGDIGGHCYWADRGTDERFDWKGEPEKNAVRKRYSRHIVDCVEDILQGLFIVYRCGRLCDNAVLYGGSCVKTGY